MSKTAVFVLRVASVVLNIVAGIYLIRYTVQFNLSGISLAVIGIILMYVVLNLSAVMFPRKFGAARMANKLLIIVPNVLVLILGWVIALQGKAGIAFGDAVTVALAFTMFPILNVAAVWASTSEERSRNKKKQRQ